MEQEKVEKLLRAKLKERGLKITQQRLLVLSTLAKSSGNHMAAEELYAQIQQQYPEIGLATVYRTLQLLYEMQLTDRINLDDGCVRYEIGHLFEGEMKHSHHHLICRKCGKVFPFDGDLLDGLETHIYEKTGFHIVDHELKFYGVCKQCIEQEKNSGFCQYKK